MIEAKRLRIAGLALLGIVGSSFIATAQDEGTRDEGFFMTFHLIPSEHWSSGKPSERAKRLEGALPEGKVYMYRHGEQEPAVELEANIPGRVPEGFWYWIAEAPGYVSTHSGGLRVSSDLVGEKTYVWEVVPACRYTLNPADPWRAVHRLDFVSFKHNFVYPLFPAKKKEIWIPTGHNLTYSVGSRGLVGIRDLGACGKGSSRAVQPPVPPPADQQDFMFSLRLSEGLTPEEYDWSKLVVGLHPTGKGSPSALPVNPIGRLWTGDQWSFFVMGAASDVSWELVVEHPKFRTEVESIESQGGSARSLATQVLRERLQVVLPIDYRPKQKHTEAKLEVFYCARTQEERRFLTGPCQDRIYEEPLKEGPFNYVVPNVDTGSHHLHALIDGTRVEYLANNVELNVLDSQAEPPVFPVIPIHEKEIFGNILKDGDPVQGEVRIRPNMRSRASFGVDTPRVFPTDDQGFYHLYYFASLWWADSLDSEEPKKRGIYPGLQWIQACDEEGFCRTYNHHSSLVGEGRLDFDLDGGGRKLAVAISAAATGEPVSGATVRMYTTEPALHFDDGSVEWAMPRGREPMISETGSDGRTDLWVPRDFGGRFMIQKEGFADYRGDLPASADVLEIKLDGKERPAEPPSRVTFADSGEAVGRATFLVKRDDRLDPNCSVSTNADGEVWFDDLCLASGRALLLHPAVRISVFDVQTLRLTPEIRVEKAPRTPLVLKVTDTDGLPVANLTVSLHYPGLTLTPNDQLFAARTTPPLFLFTDAAGQLVLRGVDPSAAVLPRIRPAVGDGFRGEVNVSEAYDGVLHLTVE